MADKKNYMRFTLKTAKRVKDELGVDIKNLEDFIDDEEKLYKVICIAYEEGGIKREVDAQQMAEGTTKGEFLETYSNDLGLSFLKKMMTGNSL